MEKFLKVLTTVLLFVFLASSTFVYAESVGIEMMGSEDFLVDSVQENSVQVDYVPGEIIVKYKDGVNVPNLIQKKSLKSKINVSEIEKEEISLQNTDLYRIPSLNKNIKSAKNVSSSFNNGIDSYTQEILDVLNNDPNIEFAEPNYIYTSSFVPNDPRYLGGYLGGQWSHQSTDAEEGWDIEQGDPDITIAIIDTGVYYTHEDLAGNMKGDCSNGGCPEGAGYDFVDIDLENHNGSGFVEGEDYEERDNDPIDFQGHGTHCAGVAAGVGNNNVGIIGVCPNCTILPIRAGYAYDSVSYFQGDAVLNAIAYATDNGADVISMSFGSGDSEAMRQAISNAHEADVVLVAAAGNTGEDIQSYPAAYDEVISVTSITSRGVRSSFSSYGPWTDVAAPGSWIWSTVPYEGVLVDESGYKSLSGTSMAAPYVAGLAGLILSKNSELSFEEVEVIIKETATDSLNEYDDYIGTGNVNNYRALQVDSISPSISKINSPVKGALYSHDTDVIDITGIADGDSYVLSYGKGLYPEQWIEIASGDSPVVNDVLGVLDTSNFVEGKYQIRLLVTDEIGVRMDSVYFEIPTPIVQEEFEALVALFESTDGENWKNNTGWNSEINNVSSWDGVTVDGDHVIRLNLSYNDLNGHIPEEIGDIVDLQELHLYGNELTGSIPAEIGNLEKLYFLGLGNNSLTGSIPSEIGNLTNLEELNLYGNELTGSIPVGIGNLRRLYSLSLGGNNFTGSIPSEIGSLTNLQSLYLYESELTGSIPEEIGNLEKMIYLSLSGNNLTGSIPSEIENMTNLKSLSLYGNELTGSIPAEIGNLRKLTTLSLGSNNFTGSIPSVIGNITNLKFLDLGSNQITGNIPEEIGNLESLDYLDLGENNLTGLVPSGILDIPNLRVLDLGSNQLNGAISFEIGSLENLDYLNISENQFTDLSDFSNLSNLNTFNIRYNNFTFEDIEPNIEIPSIRYYPQNNFEVDPSEIQLSVGDDLILVSDAGENFEEYDYLHKWVKDGFVVESDEGVADGEFVIRGVEEGDSGTYIYSATNFEIGLTLDSKEITVIVESDSIDDPPHSSNLIVGGDMESEWSESWVGSGTTPDNESHDFEGDDDFITFESEEDAFGGIRQKNVPLEMDKKYKLRFDYFIEDSDEYSDGEILGGVYLGTGKHAYGDFEDNYLRLFKRGQWHTAFHEFSIDVDEVTDLNEETGEEEIWWNTGDPANISIWANDRAAQGDGKVTKVRIDNVVLEEIDQFSIINDGDMESIGISNWKIVGDFVNAYKIGRGGDQVMYAKNSDYDEDEAIYLESAEDLYAGLRQRNYDLEIGETYIFSFDYYIESGRILTGLYLGMGEDAWKDFEGGYGDLTEQEQWFSYEREITITEEQVTDEDGQWWFSGDSANVSIWVDDRTTKGDGETARAMIDNVRFERMW